MSKCKGVKKSLVLFLAAVMIFTSSMPLQSQKVQAAAKVSISAKKLTIDVGKSKTLTIKNAPKKVSWKLSTKKYVTIKTVKKNQIKITGKKAGATTVTATVGKKKFTCKVTVKNVKKMKDSEVLKWIEKNNTKKALLKKNDRVAYQALYYDGEGKTTSVYYYCDHDRYVQESDGSVYIDDNGDIYGFNNIEKYMYRYLIMGDMYQTSIEPYEIVLFEYDPKEKVLSQKEKNGLLTVETQGTDEMLKEATEYAGIQTKKGDQIRYQYQVNEKSGELELIKTFLVSKDGKKKTLDECKRVKNCKKYMPDQQITDTVFSKDSRTVTVIADPGTEQERTFSQTVGKGVAVYTVFEKEYTVTYKDPECTQKVTKDDTDYTKDKTLYIKKEEVKNTDDEKKDVESKDTEQEDAEILKWIESKNTTEALMEKNDRIAYQTIYYFADEKTESVYKYKDHKRYVEEYQKDVFIDENGDVYGFSDEDKCPYRYLFMGDSYEKYIPPTEGLAFRYDPEEKVVSKEEKNGILYIETINAEEVKKILEEYGFEEKEGDEIHYDYQVNVETGVIDQLTTILLSKDGKKTILQECKRVKDCEEYVPDQTLTDAVFSEDKRTITVIADPGTEQERTFTQTVGKGCAIKSYLEQGYEALYLDPECTKDIRNSEKDYNQDAILYTKKVANDG